MSYRIGIDCGSKTIKVVVIDESGALVHSLYRRHRSDIKTTLAEALHDLVWRYGDIEGVVGITGSAGIGVAELLGLPFVQEVIATTRAVQEAYPQADAIIELGGEDAKVVYLTGGLEQRMNATCAGGTGGFIDTMAFMLGSSSKNMSSLALGANRVYPIASRCAVFAQTDVRPLLNAGARTSDLAASALDAVVRQTLGGLACGRPIKGNVVFLGGPLEHIPELVRRFRLALGLSHKEGIKPPDAHLFTARGAALVATEQGKHVGADGGVGTDEVVGFGGTSAVAKAVLAGCACNADRVSSASARVEQGVCSLSDLEERVRQAANPENDSVRLPPLFTDEAELQAFRDRHKESRMERVRLFDCSGPLYLGMDAGSTAVKLAVVDEQGRLAYSDYHATEGDALKTAANMLADFYVALPRNARGSSYAYIAHATVTGYGEDLLRAGLGIDSGVVETLAHVRAAQRFRPDLTFLLDIGGQDMKAIWVRDGRVANAVLNEACSSGCGSFIEGTAYSLRATPYRFAAAALEAKEPVDLGTKCTVFMTSRVRHAQKIGVETADIAAGIAYSVVKNALFRIIGMSQLDSLGSHVVVQGGAFMSDAVLRAFELVSGLEVMRPDTAHLMGAIGAALTARMRAQASSEGGGGAGGSAAAGMGETAVIGCAAGAGAGVAAGSCDAGADGFRRDSGGGAVRSSLIGPKELAELNPKRVATHCSGCENSCALSLVEFADGKRFISGNKCHRVRVHADREAAGARDGSAAVCAQGRDAAASAQATAAASDRAVAKSLKRRPPNAIALEQRLLSRFGDVDSQSERGGACIGLLDVLNVYEQKPFWHTLLATLGFSLRVADDRRADSSGAAREGIGTIPSESVCFPAKLAHTRFYDLARCGAQGVFMPCYERGNRCPVASEYACAMADSAPLVRDGRCELVSPRLSALALSALVGNASDRAAIGESLSNFAVSCGAPGIGEDELSRAFDAALMAQQAFEEAVCQGNERAFAWARRTGGRAAILAGRPYHVDPAILHGIDNVLVDVGFSVLSPLELEAALADSSPAVASVSDDASASAPLWRPGKRLAKLARMAAVRPELELVCLQSFGCGFDAVSLAQARDVLERAGKPFTALKIDDIADTAHIRIRLRTLAETLEAER